MLIRYSSLGKDRFAESRDRCAENPRAESEEKENVGQHRGILKHDALSSGALKKKIRFAQDHVIQDRDNSNAIANIAKDMLFKCNVYTRKNECSTKSLRKGEGILASTAYAPSRDQFLPKLT